MIYKHRLQTLQPAPAGNSTASGKALGSTTPLQQTCLTCEHLKTKKFPRQSHTISFCIPLLRFQYRTKPLWHNGKHINSKETIITATATACFDVSKQFNFKTLETLSKFLMEGNYVGNTLPEMHFIISVPFSLRIPFFGDYNLHTPILFCAGGVHLHPTWQTQACWQQGFFSLLRFTDTLKLSTDALGSPQQPSLTTTPIYLLIKKTKRKKPNIFHNYKEQFCIYLHY